MNDIIKKSTFGKITFVLLSFTLLLGFYFNEDASGGGSAADFYNTWGYNIALKDNILVDSTPWTFHFPLHHILLSRLHYIISDEYWIRFFFCIVSISLPFLFYRNLRYKYKEVSDNKLWLLSSLIFILPAYRYSAIWANDHITAYIFILLSTLNFLKWENEKDKNNLNLNIFFQCFFLSLAVYCRQYYALLFIYFLFIYFKELSIKNFIIISGFVFLLSIPGILIVINQSDLVTLAKTNKFDDGLLINSSIISLYTLPIFFLIFFENKKFSLKNTKTSAMIISAFISIILVYVLAKEFNYDYKVGGGFFLKLSLIIFKNKILFYFMSFIGFMTLIYLSLENKRNLILILLLIFVLSVPAYNFQKLFEPLFLFLFFIIFNSKLPREFLNNYKNLIYCYFYFSAYLISAILNDILRITQNI